MGLIALVCFTSIVYRSVATYFRWKHEYALPLRAFSRKTVKCN